MDFISSFLMADTDAACAAAKAALRSIVIALAGVREYAPDHDGTDVGDYTSPFRIQKAHFPTINLSQPSFVGMATGW